MKEEIRPGDYFEDCGFSPSLCVHTEDRNGECEVVHGVSLVDGTIRTCVIDGCGPRKLTFHQALHIRFRGPDVAYIKRCQSPLPSKWKPEQRWWEEDGLAEWADGFISPDYELSKHKDKDTTDV